MQAFNFSSSYHLLLAHRRDESMTIIDLQL